MVARRDIGGWLEGPGVGSDTRSEYPGERLNRPRSGPGSMARPGRRLLGIAIDWALALLVARALPASWHLASVGPLAVLLVEHAVLVGTAGFSVGHRVVGVRVVRPDGSPPGLGRAALRSFLLCLAIPAVVWDADQRGLHDKAAGTLLERR